MEPTVDGYNGLYKYIMEYNAKLQSRRQKCVKTWIRIMKASLICTYYRVIQIKSERKQFLFVAYHW